jgi:hypothetical protein
MPIGHIEKGIRKILYHKMIITAHYQEKGGEKTLWRNKHENGKNIHHIKSTLHLLHDSREEEETYHEWEGVGKLTGKEK